MNFGRGARAHWTLDPDSIFLNHGSFGACPKVVLEAQAKIRADMERNPDEFFDAVSPKHGSAPVRAAAEALADFVGAKGDGLAFVENATTGVQAVLQSFPLAAGDEILISNHQYNAVRLAAERRAAETGAVVVAANVPVPATADVVRKAVREAVSKRTKLAIIDHITSVTGLIFPVEEIVRDLRSAGVRVLVDGAHSVGQIPLNIEAIGADWYVTNLHKWLFAAKGCALLWASDEVEPITKPAITSHYLAREFPYAFDYVGTRDYSAWLAAPAALAFYRELGPGGLHAHIARLLDLATTELATLGAEPVGAREMCAAMRAFVLPTSGDLSAEAVEAWRQCLWRNHRLRTKCDVFGGRLLLRISGQAYVDEADIAVLLDVLAREGWPERATNAA